MSCTTPNAALQSLPQEILDVIFDLLYLRDLKPLRLSCKRLETVAIQHIFQRVHVSLSKKSLSGLTSLTQSPYLIENIRELVWDDRKIQYEFTNRTKWEEEFSGPLTGLPAGHRQMFYEIHLRLYKEQQEIREVQSQLEPLTYAFSNFRSLRRITFTDKPELEALLGISSSQLLRSRALRRACTWALKSRHRQSDQHGRPIPIGLGEVISALAKSTIAAKELLFRCDAEPWLNSISHLTEETCTKAFKPFRNIDLRLETPRDDIEELDDHYNWRFRASIFSSAQNLQSLTWHVGNLPSYCGFSRNTEDNRLDLPLYVPRLKLNPDLTWPQLRRLSLHHFRIRQSELLTFLDRHSESLRHINFYDIYVKGGRWATVFEDMLEKQMNLESAEIHNVHDEEFLAWPDDLGQEMGPKGWEPTILRFLKGMGPNPCSCGVEERRGRTFHGLKVITET